MCMNLCEISINNVKCISNIMVFNEKSYRKIMKEGRYVFEMLEEYDKTREWM